MTTDLTFSPTERLAILALRVEAAQTLEQLQANTGTKTAKHLQRALRTLRLARIVIANQGDDGVERYSLGHKPANAKS